MADLDAAAPGVSVLHQLNACNRRLAHMLDNLRSASDAEAALRAVAADVIHAVEANADIAIAAVLLNQIAGSYAVRHCIETAVLVAVLARRLGKSGADIQTVAAAALTMNVGMLGHQDSFQDKHTPLSGEEQAIVRRHPEDSATLLQCAGVQDQAWISCVLLHHENDDGSGYPAGLARPEVTLDAKLLSLADRYCALVSARNYRRSMLPDAALRKLRDDRASPVDPGLLDLFRDELGDYPPGCLVRLHGGDIGVVSTRGAGAGTAQVVCLRDAAGMAVPAGARSLPATAIAAALSEDDADIRFSMKQVWGPQAGL
ncbi:metal-dependent phosphohydrolase [Duganella sp. Leaf126]|uniref:HD-GYP domain-containing protein n=1 Tax=Duganella sp. Leaf126 TaxID=1736266 RepID=UPI0007019102|nr:HD domain-containing phosphohydrolase [Duganella sp. Leaf126]KQQ40335.1 metal-dependent phosphohydrolase [Duganella sp. Leaf126]